MDSANKASLARAIKQTRPFADLEHETYLTLLRTASELAHQVDQLLKPCNITQPQYNILRILQGAGDQGLCRNEIASRMVTHMPDVSRLLDRMEATGLIARERSRDDRRQVATLITEDGRAVLKRLAKPLAQLHKDQFNGIHPDTLRTLLDVLTEVRARIN